MKNILVLVEGPAEETFVRDVLAPYFIPFQVFIIPKVLVTKVVPGGTNFTGGHGKNYGHIQKDLQLLLQNQKHFLVTTMLDFYGLPSNTPGVDQTLSLSDCYDKVAKVEESIERAFSHPNLKIYLSLHEFETFAFVDESLLESLFPGNQASIQTIKNIKQKFGNIEKINLENPPSKRLQNVFSSYRKPFDGPLLASCLGIDSLYQSCRHFAEWVDWIKA
ncbi:MAG TPA: DUF4276 family protein [Candidatus Kapabacteria bacterium]|nr:DUF4276 family protein [Candidatus Kapabacteria bacterium]HET6402521.1 DUF4276 family protein [Candidatus Kapabacteria bacterium]